jgi:iron complex transport system substrate-binding protein
MKQLTTLLLSVIVLSACTSPQNADNAPQDSIVITDALEREVILPIAPMKIVINGKALVMISDAAYIFPEAPDRIIGLGNIDQGGQNFIDLIDPNFEDKTELENNASAEQIAVLQPDLVILKSYLAETVGKPIEDVGIPVIYVDFETPEQYTRDLEILGQVFQNPDRAKEVAVYYQNKVKQIQMMVSDTEIRPRVLMLYYNDKDGNVAFCVPPVAWMQTQMVEMAGGIPVWIEATLGSGWTQVSLEQIAAWDADQIFIVTYNHDPSVVVAALEADPNWQAMLSLGNSQLHAFPGDLYSWDQPDTRWILGLTWLAGQMHPERFPELEINTEAQSFYENLYGLDRVFFENHILPTFRGFLP